MKQKNGITLIALIITVVVLLILAGVAISMVLGENGLLNNSKLAVDKYKNAQMLEEEELKNAENYILVGGTRESSNVKMQTVKSGDKNVQVPIPEGFYYVGGDIDTGVIISSSKDDENKGLDWSKEKEDAEATPGLAAHNASNTLKGDQFVWIPCDMSNYEKIDIFQTDTNVTTWGYSAQSGRWDKKTNLQEKNAVAKYGGFYVGRYEAGIGNITWKNNKTLDGPVSVSTNSYGWEYENTDFTYNKVTGGKISTKADEIPYYHSDYNTAWTLAKEMYNTNYVETDLISGTQWDMIMKYIATDKTNYTDLKSTSWGNYGYGDYELGGIRGKIVVALVGAIGTWINADGTGTKASGKQWLLTTGSTNQVQKKHIYDLAGNLWEWTQESAYFNVDSKYITNTDFDGYICRGGGFGSHYAVAPACFRGYQYSARTSVSTGFRPVLYIK